MAFAETTPTRLAPDLTATSLTFAVSLPASEFAPKPYLSIMASE
jgi:hypothetical protein